MRSKTFTRVTGFVLLLWLISVSCNLVAGGAAQPPASPVAETPVPVITEPAVTAPPPVVTDPPAATPTKGSGSAVDALKNVKLATIQIESQGTFIDPQVGLVMNGAGRGSGFIIDPSGLAVTNNHVVTGAGLFKIWIGGDASKTYNAKVLGVSECSDLAVIKIDGGPFPFLQWHEGPIDVGMEMYLAGFPLGDPEFSLTKGIISKANADGKTTWSSVQSVLEYDASSNPGNSGGPVLDAEGRVLAVHFASVKSARQAFGISEVLAKDVVEQLRTGKNLDTVGINGQAVQSEDGKLKGVWVSSVQSGSPADKAGVQAGDIITMMENLALATDGTMSSYCDILRSHNPGDTLNLTVLRFATQQVLSGQINGRQLAVVVSGGTGSQTGGNPPTGEQPAKLDAILQKLGLSSSQGELGWSSKEAIKLSVSAYMGRSSQILAPDLKAADFVLHSEVTWNTSGGLAGCGYIFRAVSDPERGQHFRLALRRLSGFPSWDIELWDKGRFQTNVSNGVLQAKALSDKNGTTSTLTLMGKGNQFTTYINDELEKIVVTNQLPDPGLFGFQAWQESGKTSCVFENSWLWIIK